MFRFTIAFSPGGVVPIMTHMGRLQLKGEPFSADAVMFLIRTKEVHVSCL